MSTPFPSPRARTTLVRRGVGGLSCVAWVALYVLGGIAAPGLTPDARALAWGGAMVASFVGWGSGAGYLLDREGEFDWGLRAAWGMALFSFVGGALVAVGVATGPVLRALVGVGVGLASANAMRARETPPRLRVDFPFWGSVAVVSVLSFMLAVGSMTDRGQWWAFDDTPAYLVFPRQLFDVGDMVQPFSFRRMSSFGAESLFQATTLVGAAAEQVNLFDRGICSVVVVAMVLGVPEASSPLVLRLFPALLVLLLPNYRLNTGAVLSGTVFFFGLYRTLELSPKDRWRPHVHPALLGLMVAAACALRPFFVLPSLATVGLAYLMSPLRERRLLEAVLVAAGATFVALLPWSIALMRSNGTPLYPPFHGGYRTESDFTHMVLGYTRVKMIWEELRYWEPIGTIHLFFIAGLVATRRDSPAYRSSYLALLAGFLMMLLLIPISDYRDLVRYAYPLELAFVLVVTIRGLAFFRRPLHPTGVAAGILVLGACAGELYFRHEEIQRSYDDMFEQTWNILTARALLPGGGHPPMYRREGDAAVETPMLSLHAERTYADLQQSIPAGAAFVAMLEEPYRFDFRRNRVDVLDLPGIVGPNGGIPIFQGPEAMARYFVSMGLRYVAYADPQLCQDLYSSRTWEQHAETPRIGPQNFIAPWVLDVFENLERLGQSRRHLFDRSGMIVIDLGGRSGRP